jgi:hypothetical protein
MLKKTLIAIAILAIAVPAFGANTVTTKKFHEFVPTKVYEYVSAAVIDVCMDVGYWIQIDLPGTCIEVHQDAGASNPFTTYSGCKAITVKTNFNATLKATAAKYPGSLGGGDWSATLNGTSTTPVNPGTSIVDVCVFGTHVKIDKLLQGDGKQKVAQVTIWVIPTAYADQT